MDDKLKSTLQKIKALADQNPEFASEMRKMFGNTSPAVPVSNGDSIKNIEKYLALDYYVDDKDSIIDYSYIGDMDVRMQLVSDNREMMRFRYGTRYHEIDFSEFCRYAQMQSEMLLNYFYFLKDGELEKIKAHILKYNSWAKLTSATSLASISYNSKIWAFRNEFGLKDINIWDNVREVRNELSHRSPEKDQMEIEMYKKKLQSMNIPLKDDGEANWYIISQNAELQTFFTEGIQKTAEYKRYSYLVWYHGKPFESIIGALKNLSDQVKKSL